MAYPIIVLEGADCSGKSTLGKFIAEQWGAQYIHATYRFPKQMFDYHTALIEKAIALSQTRPVVLDRWWPSELFYADVFRGGSKWPMCGRLLDRVALKQGVVYVACVPSNREWQLNTFKARADKGDELFDTNEAVADMYVDWAKHMAPRHDFMVYDVLTHGRNMFDFIDTLSEKAAYVKAMLIKSWDESVIKDWAGNSHQPLALILGDQANPKGRRTMWPFFEHGNSSLFLTEALEEAGVDEYDLAWYNTVDEFGYARPELLASIYDKVKPHYVVALGSNASKVAQAAGLVNSDHGYRYIHHPSYLRRFKGDAGKQQLVQFFKTIKEQG